MIVLGNCVVDSYMTWGVDTLLLVTYKLVFKSLGSLSFILQKLSIFHDFRSMEKANPVASQGMASGQAPGEGLVARSPKPLSFPFKCMRLISYSDFTVSELTEPLTLSSVVRWFLFLFLLLD